MSQLFRRASSKAAAAAAAQPDPDPNSAYSSLLDPVSSTHPVLQQHRRTRSSPVGRQSRCFTPAAAAAGERPPTRKLVKEPGGGSARPSFSLELSDSDAEKDKGIFERGIDRLKGLYRRER